MVFLSTNQQQLYYESPFTSHLTHPHFGEGIELKEPNLEFGQGEHQCPRAGIATYDVYDTRVTARRDQILVGAVGTSNNLLKLSTWLEKCKHQIPPKANAAQPNLYPGFCGFNRTYGFKAELNHSEEITRTINNSEIRKIIKITKRGDRIEEAVKLYFDEIRFLAENRNVDVIVCVIPTSLFEKIAFDDYEPIDSTFARIFVGKPD